MSEQMSKITWMVGMTVLLLAFHYVGIFHPIKAWRYAHDECWAMFYDDGYTPLQAIREDMSYG